MLVFCRNTVTYYKSNGVRARPSVQLYLSLPGLTAHFRSRWQVRHRASLYLTLTLLQIETDVVIPQFAQAIGRPVSVRGRYLLKAPSLPNQRAFAFFCFLFVLGIYFQDTEREEKKNEVSFEETKKLQILYKFYRHQLSKQEIAILLGPQRKKASPSHHS